MRNTIVLWMLLLLAGCGKGPLPEKNTYVEYFIPKGKHSTGEMTRLHRGNILKFKVIFDSSAVYLCKDSINQYSLNKLLGFSDCGTRHQQNSARLGWRWHSNNLELHAYCYSGSEREDKFITTIEPGKSYECAIEVNETKYVLRVGGKVVYCKRNCSQGGIKYYLYPYFGGTETAPQDIRIKIAEMEE